MTFYEIIGIIAREYNLHRIIIIYFVQRRLLAYCQGTTAEKVELKKALAGALKHPEMMFGICSVHGRL